MKTTIGRIMLFIAVLAIWLALARDDISDGLKYASLGIGVLLINSAMINSLAIRFQWSLKTRDTTKVIVGVLVMWLILKFVRF